MTLTDHGRDLGDFLADMTDTRRVGELACGFLEAQVELLFTQFAQARFQFLVRFSPHIGGFYRSLSHNDTSILTQPNAARISS